MNQVSEDLLEIEAGIKGFLSNEVINLPKEISFRIEGDTLIIKPAKISNDFRNYVEYENYSVEKINICLDVFEGPISAALTYTIWYTGDFYSLDILNPKLFGVLDENEVSVKIIHKRVNPK